jgi:hypothetical protein
LTVQDDQSLGPIVTQSLSFKKLLTKSGGGCIAEIAEASRNEGTEVFFDLYVKDVSSTAISFEFRTKVGQPGTDLTDRMVFDQERGNLKNPSLEFDWSEEENYIYGLGAGVDSTQAIEQACDASRYGLSIWNRCEGTADARDQEELNGVQAIAQAAVDRGRPLRHFTGNPQDVRGTRFGIDWNFGDKVKARYRGYDFDAIIRSVVVSVKAGKETVSAKIEWEGA